MWKTINELPDPPRNKVILIPATVKLYEVRAEFANLRPDEKQKFHRIVAQLLYILKRARPNLAPALPFLTTRVCEPKDDDWLKLKHVIEYLSATTDLCLVLHVDKSNNPVFSIDTAHQTNDDCKGYTGEVSLWVRDLCLLYHVNKKLTQGVLLR